MLSPFCAESKLNLFGALVIAGARGGGSHVAMWREDERGWQRWKQRLEIVKMRPRVSRAECDKMDRASKP